MNTRRLPKMSKGDVEAFVRIHAGLTAAHSSLNQSSWSGRHAVIHAIEQADLLITDMFNRCERAVLGKEAAAELAGNVNDQSVLTAQVEFNQNLDPNLNGQGRV